MVDGAGRLDVYLYTEISTYGAGPFIAYLAKASTGLVEDAGPNPALWLELFRFKIKIVPVNLSVRIHNRIDLQVMVE